MRRGFRGMPASPTGGLPTPMGGMGRMGRMGGAPNPMALNLAAGRQQRLAMMQRDGMAGGQTFNSPRSAPVGALGSNAPKMNPLSFMKGTPMPAGTTLKKGGMVKKASKGSSASKRADGCVIKGKTKGRMV